MSDDEKLSQHQQNGYDFLETLKAEGVNEQPQAVQPERVLPVRIKNGDAARDLLEQENRLKERKREFNSIVQGYAIGHNIQHIRSVQQGIDNAILGFPSEEIQAYDITQSTENARVAVIKTADFITFRMFDLLGKGCDCTLTLSGKIIIVDKTFSQEEQEIAAEDLKIAVYDLSGALNTFFGTTNSVQQEGIPSAIADLINNRFEGKRYLRKQTLTRGENGEKILKVNIGRSEKDDYGTATFTFMKKTEKGMIPEQTCTIYF